MRSLIMQIRFRDMPTFGRDSIRRFTNSVSELKKLGARDYENLLQVSNYADLARLHDQIVTKRYPVLYASF